MDFLHTVFGTIGDLTWGWSLIPFLVIFGVFITIATGFVQVRYFRRMFRVLKGDNQSSDPNTITAGEALFVSVGGPGAVFWMWAIALVSMATSLVECSLAQVFKRRQDDGSYRGGPARMIIYGLGKDYKWLAVLYAISLLAAFGIGFPAFQGNTVAGAAENAFGLNRLLTGALLAVGTAFIVFGGIQRIAKASDIIVPVMALTYIALALVVIMLNIGDVPAAFSTIVANAFGIEEAVSGGMGAAIAQGLRRGLFSNEAGLGSAPNVAATAEVRHPISQGITQSFSVFIDTIIICTCTALVILLSDAYVPGADIDGVVLTQNSLVEHLGSWTQYFLTFAVLLFAFSSIIYNYYLGENALTVFSKSKAALMVFKLVLIGVTFLGAVAPGATAVFFFSDPMMGILALVNLLALLMLCPVLRRVLRDFDDQRKAGVERPVFDPAKFPDLDIDHSAWANKG